MNRWIFAVAWILLLAACGDDSSSRESQNRKLLQSPPYASLTDSIEQFPKQAALYVQRGVLLSQHNLHELATPDYKQAWALSPDETTGLLYISNLLLINKLKDATGLLQECIAKFPDNAEFRRRLSEVYAQTGQQTKAMQQYDELLQKDSADAETWFEKGRLLAQLQDTAGALHALRQAYTWQPVNYYGIELARIYAATLDPHTVALCDSLLAKDTTNTQTDPLFLKGTFYSDTRQYALALKTFDECIARDWKLIDAYIEKGIVLFEQKQFDSALSVFKMGVTVSNTDPDLYYWMGRCFEATGNRGDALLNYQRALAIDKNFVEAEQRIKWLDR